MVLSSISSVYAGGDGRFTKDPPKIERYELVNDGGGSVEEFKEALQMIAKEKRGIKIDGYCASACTMVMNDVYKLDVCITDKASLMIHKPFMVKYSVTGYEIVKTLPAILNGEKIYQKDFYQRWPLWMRTEVDRRGGAPTVYTGLQPSDMMVLSFDFLKQYMVQCNS